MFEIGQKIDRTRYTAAAVWCNQNGAHLEVDDGDYVIVANRAYVPTAQERLTLLERQTGLSRAVRELVLAEQSGASDYARQKARELEALAAELRP